MCNVYECTWKCTCTCTFKNLHLYIHVPRLGFGSLTGHLTTTFLMTFHLNGHLISKYYVKEACLCFVNIFLSPFQMLVLMDCPDHQAISTTSEYPSQTPSAPQDADSACMLLERMACSCCAVVL